MAARPVTDGPEALAQVELLRDLLPPDRASIAERCRFRRYRPQQPIIELEDERCDVYFLLSGRVRVTYFSVSGREVSFGDRGPGQVFGELAAIDGKARSATVVALTECSVASLPAAEFRALLAHHERIADAVLRHLAAKVRLLTERVVEFSTLAVRNRIHAELLRLAQAGTPLAKGAAISPAPTHADIASRISTHREAVTRELAELARAGLVVKRGGDLVVPDLAALARMVEDMRGE